MCTRYHTSQIIIEYCTIRCNQVKYFLLSYYLQAISADDQTVTNISFCPCDNNVIATFGNRVSKILRWSEGMLQALIIEACIYVHAV